MADDAPVRLTAGVPGNAYEPGEVGGASGALGMCTMGPGFAAGVALWHGRERGWLPR